MQSPLLSHLGIHVMVGHYSTGTGAQPATAAAFILAEKWGCSRELGMW